MKLLLFFSTALLFSTFCFSQSKGLDLVSKMISDGITLKSMKFDLAVKERIKTKSILSKSSFKVQYSPFKVYVHQEFPNKNMELLYVSGTNNNDVLVNPAGFPWTNLNLAPNSSIMRKDIHHSIFDSGYKYVYSIIAHLLQKHAEIIEKNIVYDGEVTIKGVKCHKITMTTPGFKYTNYTIKPGESAHSIAAKLHINDYMLIDKNKGIDEFSDFEPGMSIKVPSDYASKMEMYIEVARNIPFIMKIYDEAGIYEEYEFTNVVLNCKFDAEEFSPKYKDYKF